MAEYISTFPTGFGEIVAQALPSLLPGARVLCVYDGLIRYAYPRGPKEINSVPCFNNSYCVLRSFQGKSLSFHRMVKEIELCKLRYPAPEGTFRIRFSQSNRFVKVEKQISLRAENAVAKASRLTLDRLNPATELWYVIRDEGFGFYGQLLRKRAATEKDLHPGELRPEFAWLLCLCGNPTKQSVILDPFAGYGAIPAQIARRFPSERLVVSDNDPGKARALKKALPANVQVSCEDALNLAGIADNSTGLIVTDPPWGYYERIGDIALFYQAMLKEFWRVLKPDGRAVILSARKDELTRAVEETGIFMIEMTIHTLVNGKKAGVYVLAKIEV
ncbi:MAG: methyltransferase [Oscillospiraceae bacterium]|jgi:23S rRNA G2445 N2-methylase RlmL|nr:methyltransferase [Oscillospiraceae bacterium]